MTDRALLAKLDNEAFRQGNRPSNTERGHAKDLFKGKKVSAQGASFVVGCDLHDVARGGTKTTKRNRILVETVNGVDHRTYFKNTPAGREHAVKFARMVWNG